MTLQDWMTDETQAHNLRILINSPEFIAARALVERTHSPRSDEQSTASPVISTAKFHHASGVFEAFRMLERLTQIKPAVDHDFEHFPALLSEPTE